MSKKGSLELSVNAIVIIIIAMAMLGVGTYFIKDVFGGAANEMAKSLQGIDDQRKEAFLSSCTDEVCIEDTIKIEKGSKDTLLLAINNKYDCDIVLPLTGTGAGASISQEGVCKTIDTNTCEGLTLKMLDEQIITKGEKILVPVIISSKPTTNIGTYRFAIKVAGKCAAPNSAITINSIKYFNVEVIG